MIYNLVMMCGSGYVPTPPEPWDLDNLPFVDTTTITELYLNLAGSYFSPDGSLFFAMSSNSVSTTYRDILKFSLSTPYLLSSRTLIQTKTNYTGLATLPRSITFKPDGKQMYLADNTGDSIRWCTLSTAWDLSTATLTASKSISAQTINPSGVFFGDNGRKMYLGSNSTVRIWQFNLGTAWNVSTASFVQSYDPVSSATSIYFKADGTRMFTVSSFSDVIGQYELTSAWDISTASLTKTKTLVASNTSSSSLLFNGDGTKMFVSDGELGSPGDRRVYNYSFA
jgi:DNA-binding beta-propeller fold protein YncE